MKSNTPQVLLDIVEVLKNSNLSPSNLSEDRRDDSKVDEDNIIEWLKNHPLFKNRVKKERIRSPADMTVMDYDNKTVHLVNIKTTNGGTDNAYSKAGVLYALTDIPVEDIMNISSIQDDKFYKSLVDNKKNVERDYWYLTFNKKDFTNIVIKGTKQIVNWVSNPSNGLQINWKHELDATPIDNTFEETYNIIVGKIVECWIKKGSQHTTAIADYNKRHESQQQ